MSVDSTVCRAHQHAAGARKEGPYDPGRTPPDGLAAEPDDHALGRSRGGLTTKIHLAVDASFHVLAAVITAGQRADAPVFTEVMDRIRVPRIGGGHPRTRPDHVLADRAYSSRQIRAYLRRRQIPHTIPEKRDQARHRMRRGTAGGRPPGFNREMYKRRHKIECRIGLLKQARGVATRFDKLAVRYEAHRPTHPDMPGVVSPSQTRPSSECVAASAAFYDAVLAPLGGERLMDLDEVIGHDAAEPAARRARRTRRSRPTKE